MSDIMNCYWLAKTSNRLICLTRLAANPNFKLLLLVFAPLMFRSRLQPARQCQRSRNSARLPSFGGYSDMTEPNFEG